MITLRELMAFVVGGFAILLLPPSLVGVIAAITIATIVIRYTTVEKELRQKEKK
jgi:uncharacterized membrane protein YccF (DUF307 family)